MINRRHIRVKVMQSVYAMLHSKSDNLPKEEKFLYHSIDKMYELYVSMMQLLIEVRNMERNHMKIASQKFLATPEELKPSTKFVNNSVLLELQSSPSLAQFIEDHKIARWEIDTEFVNEIWKSIKESDVYKKYMASEKKSFKEDKDFVIEVFKQVVAPNEKLADYYEGEQIGWTDDLPFVNTWVVKSLSKMKEHHPFNLGDLYKDEDDEKFVVDLFRKVILNHEKFESDIAEVTPNWDADRIADIDMILLKMAISEFLYFPSIPTRVTINEYIEISKDYSTTKSSFFINGVLDKLLKKYTESKSLNKVGRGLL